MADLPSTFRLLLLVLLVSFGVEGQNDTDCKHASGDCIPVSESDSCDAPAEFLRCDNDDEVCCLPPSWGKTIKRDPCKDVVDRNCKKMYKGKCRTECSAKFIHVGMCNNRCKCCGCKIKNKCKKKQGHCIKKGKECYGKENNKWCKGKECTCCYPRCPDTEECADVRGFCNETCSENHETHATAKCNTDNDSECKCCVRKNPCDIQTRTCTIHGGTCKASCRFFETPVSVAAVCEGVNCACCVPNIATAVPFTVGPVGLKGPMKDEDDN